MHPLFQLGEMAAAAPGSSPFHVRGLYYARMLGRGDRLPDGRESLMRALKDARVRDFMQQQFAWSEWYDALPSMPVHVALARLEGESFEAATRKNAALAASEIVPKVFKFAIEQAADGVELTEEAPRMFASQYDFGEIESKHDGESLTVTIAQLPRAIAASVSYVMLGAITATAEHLGRHDVEATVDDVVRDGQLHGFEVVRATLGVRWG